MIVSFPILAQPLAKDNLWCLLAFLLALAVMAGFRALGNRVAEHRKAKPHLHELSHRPHEPISHSHH